MNKKMSKRQKDIKSKLMAAICMLLVSSIMMVSSTYAWFTLSTAPEVTGIQTAVGANGNLEMALQPYSGDLAAITSAEGDSLLLPAQRNITWGNLVDVSENATYGMNNITLYPATLNTAVEGKVNANPLGRPAYGADGRVSTVNNDTLTGAFDPSKAQFSESMSYGGTTYTNAKGVRAIGVSSGLSARELAHRNAMAAALNEKDGANADAGKTLNANGSAVGNIAVKHALGNDASGYTQEEIQPLKNAVNDLSAIADRIEKSLKNYLLANSIAPATAENTYVDIVNNIEKAATLADAEAVTGAVVPTNAAYTTAKSELAELRSAITEAQKINELTDNTVYWDDLSPKLQGLVNIDLITVNGFTMNDIKATEADQKYQDEDGKYIDGKTALINQVLADNSTAKINMPSGSGVFADIADFTGNYSASFKMKVSYGSLSVNANAEMYATAGAGTLYLDQVKTNTASYSAGDGTTTTAKPITTFYGYILDLAFRTNASGSYLQLQPTAVDRIYSDGTNTGTMGHGATMTFQTDSPTFGEAGVKALMANIRIIFFDTADSDIIAYAKLDTGNVTSANGAVTMPIMLTKDDTSTADIVSNFEIAKGDNQIMELEQNTAKALSVMVYLDGKDMTNADVAADAAQSMYGSMNLQFSSSADLKPMEYADLKADSGNTDESYSPLNGLSVPSGYTYRAYSYGGKIGIQLTPPTGTSLDSASVSIEIVTGTDDSGNETKTAALTTTKGELGTVEGYVVDIPEDVTVDSNTKIYVTVTGATEVTP